MRDKLETKQHNCRKERELIRGTHRLQFKIAIRNRSPHPKVATIHRAAGRRQREIGRF